MDMQKFFDTLFYLYGKENNLTITYTIERIK